MESNCKVIILKALNNLSPIFFIIILKYISIIFTDIYEQLKFNLYQDDAVTGKRLSQLEYYFYLNVEIQIVNTLEKKMFR